jgi:two-component system chemotaxis response regulator CheB
MAQPTRTDLREVGNATRIVAIGASTGGGAALENVLSSLPVIKLGIVIVQHMPKRFTAMFAERLDNVCAIKVREAKNGDEVLPGQALIAPGGSHMTLHLDASRYYVAVADGPLVNHQKPSVDVLFSSVAQAAGPRVLGIIMTGMGNDGAVGLKEIHDAGAQTIAQDEKSCVVFGMPRAAIALGGVDKIIPLARIPQEIVAYCR